MLCSLLVGSESSASWMCRFGWLVFSLILGISSQPKLLPWVMDADGGDVNDAAAIVGVAADAESVAGETFVVVGFAVVVEFVVAVESVVADEFVGADESVVGVADEVVDVAGEYDVAAGYVVVVGAAVAVCRSVVEAVVVE